MISQDNYMVIRQVEPCLDAGRYAVKKELGDTVDVSAKVFREGHGIIKAGATILRVDPDPPATLITLCRGGAAESHRTTPARDSAKGQDHSRYCTPR